MLVAWSFHPEKEKARELVMRRYELRTKYRCMSDNWNISLGQMEEVKKQYRDACQACIEFGVF